jgi:hypothetical protein
MSFVSRWRFLTPLLLVGVIAANCAHKKVIPGTTVRDSPQNRKIIDVVENYRRAMQELRMADLMAMAHPHYYEHSGTPKGDDDYGYKGLLQVIRARVGQLVSVHFNMKYLRVSWLSSEMAEVEVYISANFQLKTSDGDRWHRMTDYNKFVLVKVRDRWLFVRGM